MRYGGIFNFLLCASQSRWVGVCGVCTPPLHVLTPQVAMTVMVSWTLWNATVPTQTHGPPWPTCPLIARLADSLHLKDSCTPLVVMTGITLSPALRGEYVCTCMRACMSVCACTFVCVALDKIDVVLCCTNTSVNCQHIANSRKRCLLLILLIIIINLNQTCGCKLFAYNQLRCDAMCMYMAWWYLGNHDVR